MYPEPLPDSDLTSFLKQHQPLCPPPPAQLEQNLMTIIARSPQPKRQKPWGILTLLTICTGAGLGIIAFKLNSPESQTAQHLTDRERVEIVSYLLEEWQIHDLTPSQSLNQQWLEIISE